LFLGIAVIHSDTPYLLSEIDNRGSFNDTLFGINMGPDHGDGLQLAARPGTEHGNKDMELDRT